MVRPHILKDHTFTGFAQNVANLVESKRFVNFITVLIVLNAISLGLETNDAIASQYGQFLSIFDCFVLYVFAIEVALKLYIYRFHFFKNGWNVFDFLIVGISLVPQSAGLSILRALRILRLFRLIALIPQMRNVIGALLLAIPGMGAIIGVLIIFLYIAAVLSAQIFGQHPDPALQEYFGSLGASMYTMFQIMTLEGWPDIARATLKHFPWAWTFFVPFIIVTGFAVLNLFIGIIVDALNVEKENHINATASHNPEDDLQKTLTKIQKDIEHIKKNMNTKQK